MTTNLLSARCLCKIIAGGDCHDEKSIERGGKKAVARRSDAAKRQELRVGGAGRRCGSPDRVHMQGVA